MISDLFSALRLNSGRMRRICGTIAPASIMVFLAGAALAVDMNARLADDITLTKATVAVSSATNLRTAFIGRPPGNGLAETSA